MDNLGTEVGQKMRSAVKAKLIELGTGGSAGYIDDELPDYVMIMVANKRSKQQMIGDLNLFLGTNTELFVTWLHEVLQKLQEVTLPANVVQKVKRKAAELETITTNKKEKKEKKKDKKLKRSNSEKTAEEVASTSIQDVVADHLLQKAKKTMEVEASIKVKEKKEPQTDEFDIPTITEIAERNVNNVNNKKELAELEALQKKIDQAKRQLKAIETDESEDEDFLNIKEDAEEFDDDVNDKTNKKNKGKSPILFDSTQTNDDSKENSSDQERHKRRIPITFNNNNSREEKIDPTRAKRPVHERLGYKPPAATKFKENVINLTAHRRVEKELYVPTFRRKELDKDREKDVREKDKEREPERTRERDREKPKEKTRSDKDDKFNIKQRIGSRVIVAPPKPEFNDEEENDDRSISSMIKIKPRPPVSPSKQASKNLLLRAVAEAQKSTALIKPKIDAATTRTASPNSSRSQKLYSKSYRDRNREALLRRAAKDNIVIEVNAEKRPLHRLDKTEDEYIPEPISDRGDSDNDFIYVPRAINSANSDDDLELIEEEDNCHRNRTQFVVTLDDKSRDKFTTNHKIRVVEKSLNGIEIKRLEINNEVTSTSRPALTPLSVSTSSPKKDNHHAQSKQQKQAKQSGLVQSYKKPKDVKKLIIQNDSEDDDSSSPTKEKRSRAMSEERSTTPPLPPKPAAKSTLKRKRSTVSPIKFDLNDGSKEPKRRSKSGDRDAIREEQKDDENQKISTKKVEKKYDNIPELLSSVPVDASGVKTKTKERCKYFPTCGKGDSCEFLHPSAPCKTFPNCKYAEKCLYLHPKCKFDLTCNRVGCNFQHSVPVTPTAAPPLSSHVVPVQNYKSISATPLPPMCKFYPNCTNGLCNFYHPKLCRFGKNCMNKVECNFYHHDLPTKDKFKWVASLG